MDAKDPRGSLKAIKADGRRRNRHWKRRWKNVVKHDQDWDYRYFLDIILHKLYLMYERYTDPKQCKYLADEEKKKIADSLSAAIEIGERLRDNEYMNDAEEFFDKHATLSPNLEAFGNSAIVWDSEESKREYKRLAFEEAPKKYQADKEAFFGTLAKNFDSWWD